MSVVPSIEAPGGSCVSWLREVTATVRRHLTSHGAVLVRGLRMREPADLAGAREALGMTPFEPTEAFARRRDLGDGVISPLPWPDERPLCQFQEGSFSAESPAFVLAACVEPPSSGGEARLADMRRVADHLPADLVDRVRTLGWSMTRVFHEGFGITWQEAFAVTDVAELESVLATAGIDHQWRAGSLRTVRTLAAFVHHPVTGEECWFNDLAFLNAASMEPRERALLTSAFGDDLPVDTALGDGTPLLATEVSMIQSAYEQVTSSISWGPGDVLVVDNVMTSCGRASLEGAPEFLFALGEDGSGQRA